jgi:hypothetical protein
VAVGGLREVQLLGVTRGAEPRVRFVTTYHADLPGSTPARRRTAWLFALYERPLPHGVQTGEAPEVEDLGSPQSWMTVAHPILGLGVAEYRRRWWYLETPSGPIVVSFDSPRGIVHVTRFPDALTVANLSDVADLLDVRRAGTGIELLIRSDAGIEYLRLGGADVDAAWVAERRTLLELAHLAKPLDAVATFASRTSGDELGRADDWVVVAHATRDAPTQAQRADEALRVRKLEITFAELGSEQAAHHTVGYDAGFLAWRAELQLAVDCRTDGLTVALADPTRGRFTHLSWTPEAGVRDEQTLALDRRGLMQAGDGHPAPEWKILEATHALAFVSDVDEDGGADLLVAVPFAGQVHLVSSRITADLLASAEDSMFTLGSCLALDATGGYALISGDEADLFRGSLVRSRARLMRIGDGRGQYMQELAHWSFDGMGLRIPAKEIQQR